MGYSGRYHAASLAAVFIALAVGILIGIGLADDVVSSASEELEASLRSDLKAAQGHADDLQSELDRSDRFSTQILPEALAGRLAGRQIAIVELGGSDEDLVAAARDAVESGGGQIAAVAQIALPPDEQAMLDALPARHAKIRHDADPLTRIGEAVGRELSGGGPVIRAIEQSLFARFSGSLRDVDGLVITRVPPELDPGDRNAADSFEAGILDGVAASGPEASGAELATTDPGTLAPFIDAGISTVDDLDLPAGKVALAYVLDGVRGNYGVKDEAGSYLPPFTRGGGSP